MDRKHLFLSSYLLSLLVILVLLAVVLTATYAVAEHQIRRQVRASDAAAFREAVFAAETRLALADVVLFAVLGDRQTEFFMRRTRGTPGETVLAAHTIQRGMQSFRSVVPGLRSVSVVSYMENTIVTESGMFPAGEYWDPVGLDLLRTSPVTGTVAVPRDVPIPLEEGRRTVNVTTIARSFPLAAAPQSAIGGALLHIDSDSILRPFFELYERTGVDVRITDASGTVVLHARREVENQASFPLETGERSRWIYVGYPSQRRFQGGPTVFQTLFVAIAVVGLAVAGVVVTVLDRKTRRPLESAIRHIVERVARYRRNDAETVQDAPLSVGTVHQRVRSLVEIAGRLESQVEVGFVALRRQLLIEQLLSSVRVGPESLSGLVGTELSGPYFTVMISPADDDGGIADRIARSDVATRVQEGLRPLGDVETLTLLEGSRAFILSSLQPPSASRVAALLNDLIAPFPSMVIAVGDVYTGTDAMHRSYLSAREALEQRIVSPRQRVYLHAAYRDDTPMETTWMVERNLRELPDLLRRTPVKRAVAVWMENHLAVIEEHAGGPAQVKHAVVAGVLALQSEMQRRGTDTDGLGVEDTIRAIWGATSRMSVRATASAFAERAIRAMKEAGQPVGRRDSLAGRLCAYVERNYDEPNLSLNAAADAFQITPSYASRLFHEETGRTFQQFVTWKRLSDAAERLVRSHDRVTSIAHAVGYLEVRTFIRAFRRTFGETPLAFRRRHLGEDSTRRDPLSPTVP